MCYKNNIPSTVPQFRAAQISLLSLARKTAHTLNDLILCETRMLFNLVNGTSLLGHNLPARMRGSAERGEYSKRHRNSLFASERLCEAHLGLMTSLEKSQTWETLDAVSSLPPSKGRFGVFYGSSPESRVSVQFSRDVGCPEPISPR